MVRFIDLRDDVDGVDDVDDVEYRMISFLSPMLIHCREADAWTLR
ncbi:hypothetical protein [Bifidobacterium sp.]|nr:hypothetical protein [Bifidobacterium sp.]